MNKFVTCCCFLFFNTASAQQLPKSSGEGRVILHKADTIYQFFTGKPPKKHKAAADKFYSWYKNDTVLVTQGAYEARLLHGLYEIFYPNKNLMQQGSFSYGLKQGHWKEWYPEGTLKSSYLWDKGVLNGAFMEYTNTGNRLREGNFSNGVLNGKIIDYLADGTTKESIYSKGKKIEKPNTDSINASKPRI